MLQHLGCTSTPYAAKLLCHPQGAGSSSPCISCNPCQFRFLGFLCRNPCAILFQLLFDLIGYLFIELVLGVCELFLLLAHDLLALGNVAVFLRQLLLELFAGGLQSAARPVTR